MRYPSGQGSVVPDEPDHMVVISEKTACAADVSGATGNMAFGRDTTEYMPIDPDESKKVAEPWLYGRTHLLNEYTSLISAYPTIFKTDFSKPESFAPKLVLAFDEASCLRQHKIQHSTPANVICRVISAYSCHGLAPIWTVFASTDSRIADFAAPSKIRAC
jgi:hypothetical protein